MSKLKQNLRNHGIDAAQVDILFGAGREAVHGLMTGGASAVELWRRLRVAAGEIGYWPVILGGDEDLEAHGESFRVTAEQAGHLSAAEIIAAGTKIDVPAWLVERASGEESSTLASGAWPDGDLATHHFTLPVDAETGSALPRVFVGLTPTVIGWQVPAFVRFGGWNDCPSPEYHVAILRYWRQKYGAEVVGIGADVLEVAVSRPPVDRGAAMRLAREQFVYCPHVIRHAARSLETRAAMLMGATAWSFWWE